MNNESTLYLLRNVPLDRKYEHTIDFASLSAQSQFFDNLIADTMIPKDDYSYIRETEQINVYASKDDIADCNYLYYNNGDKRYYAFITSKEYVSTSCTAITFEIDVMQTFMFDYSIGESFIEREHQDRYTIGDNGELKPFYSLTQENITNGGELLQTSRQEIVQTAPSGKVMQFSGHQVFWLIVSTKEPIGKQTWSTAGGLITGTQPTEESTTRIRGLETNVYTYVIPYIPQTKTTLGGVVFRLTGTGAWTNESSFSYLFNSKDLLDLSQDPLVISINISKYCPFNFNCEQYKQESGLTFYKIYPQYPQFGDDKIYLTNYKLQNNATIAGMFYVQNIADTNIEIETDLPDMERTIEDLNPQNPKSITNEPKLYTNPFYTLKLSHGNNELEINRNDLTDKLTIAYKAAFSVVGGQSFILRNYKGEENNYENSIYFDATTNEMPLRTDAWLNYLQNNKASRALGYVTDTIGLIGSVGSLAGNIAGGNLTGAAIGAGQVIGSVEKIAGRYAAEKDLQNRPDEVKNTSQDVILNYTTKGLSLVLSTYEMRQQFKSKAFNYFYHFGYAVNDFETPNVNSRYYFNYIKTIGANIISNIDHDYIEQLQAIFDKGLTIWHYRNSNDWHGVGNYNYENAETNIVEVNYD